MATFPSAHVDPNDAAAPTTNPNSGITVSYWASEEAIRAWKHIAAHQIAQNTGRGRWYSDYVLRVAKVERSYTLATSPHEGLQR